MEKSSNSCSGTGCIVRILCWHVTHPKHSGCYVQRNVVCILCCTMSRKWASALEQQGYYSHSGWPTTGRYAAIRHEEQDHRSRWHENKDVRVGERQWAANIALDWGALVC